MQGSVRLACLLSLLALSAPSGLAAPAPAAPALAEDLALSPREQAEALVRDGARFGDQEKWDEAIRRFRAAESKFPRAIHDCNIGLAYIRSARPHLALHYLRRCEARATEPTPAWVETRRVEALKALREGPWTPLEVAVSPLGATFTVDTLPGETFAPVGTGGAQATLSLWLPAGSHQLSFAAPGHEAASRAVEAAGRTALRLEVALKEAPAAVIPDPRSLPADGTGTAAAPSWDLAGRDPRAPLAPGVCHRALPPGDGPDQYPGCLGAREPSGLQVAGWSTLGLGAAVGVVALGFGAVALSNHTKAENRTIANRDYAFYFGRYLTNYERYQWIGWSSVGVMGLGAAFLALDLLDSEDLSPPAPVTVGLTPSPGGGLLSASGRF